MKWSLRLEVSLLCIRERESAAALAVAANFPVLFSSLHEGRRQAMLGPASTTSALNSIVNSSSCLVCYIHWADCMSTACMWDNVGLPLAIAPQTTRAGPSLTSDPSGRVEFPLLVRAFEIHERASAVVASMRKCPRAWWLPGSRPGHCRWGTT